MKKIIYLLGILFLLTLSSCDGYMDMLIKNPNANRSKVPKGGWATPSTLTDAQKTFCINHPGQLLLIKKTPINNYEGYGLWYMQRYECMKALYTAEAGWEISQSIQNGPMRMAFENIAVLLLALLGVTKLRSYEDKNFAQRSDAINDKLFIPIWTILTYVVFLIGFSVLLRYHYITITLNPVTCAIFVIVLGIKFVYCRLCVKYLPLEVIQNPRTQTFNYHMSPIVLFYMFMMTFATLWIAVISLSVGKLGPLFMYIILMAMIVWLWKEDDDKDVKVNSANLKT